jgi:MarR family transcriptional regulator, transcriptional regulator for hemolysin
VLKYDFEDSVGYWLFRTHHSYVRAFQEELAPQGITFRQAQVVAILALDGPLSQAELASRMLIEPPSLVGTLDRMEASGLLERLPCPGDRRKNLIQLLPAVETVWKRIATCGRKLRRQATAGMSEREIATLKKLLNKVRCNVTPHSTWEQAS